MFVVGYEVASDKANIVGSSLSNRECSFKKFHDTATHHKSISLLRVRRKSTSRQRVVHTRSKVTNGVEQSAVEVEYYESLCEGHCVRMRSLAYK